LIERQSFRQNRRPAADEHSPAPVVSTLTLDRNVKRSLLFHQQAPHSPRVTNDGVRAAIEQHCGRGAASCGVVTVCPVNVRFPVHWEMQ